MLKIIEYINHLVEMDIAEPVSICKLQSGYGVTISEDSPYVFELSDSTPEMEVFYQGDIEIEEHYTDRISFEQCVVHPVFVAIGHPVSNTCKCWAVFWDGYQPHVVKNYWSVRYLNELLREDKFFKKTLVRRVD